MIILGIDPGTAEVGWGIVRQDQKSNIKNQKSLSASGGKNEEGRGGDIEYVSHGVIKTSIEDPSHHRLLQIRNALRQIIKDHGVEVVVVERLFFNFNQRSVMAVGQAQGVAMLCAAEEGCTLFEYTPITVKHALTGYGRSDKKIVQSVVRRRLRLRRLPRPTHSADALAVALCHLAKHEDTLIESNVKRISSNRKI